MSPFSKNSGSGYRPKHPGKLVVGVTGGAGAGKTTLARFLGELGATVIEADRVGHEVLGLPEVREQLVRAFGPEILAPDGTVDRKKLGQRTFADPRALQTLTRIVKPWIVARIQEAIRRAPTEIVVVDGALIYEYGVEHLFDRIVVVTAPEDLRLRRFMAKTGYPEAVARRLLQQQMPEEEKIRRADHVVYNTGSLNRLEHEARRLYHTWRTLLHDP